MQHDHHAIMQHWYATLNRPRHGTPVVEKYIVMERGKDPRFWDGHGWSYDRGVALRMTRREAHRLRDVKEDEDPVKFYGVAEA